MYARFFLQKQHVCSTAELLGPLVLAGCGFRHAKVKSCIHYSPAVPLFALMYNRYNAHKRHIRAPHEHVPIGVVWIVKFLPSSVRDKHFKICLFWSFFLTQQRSIFNKVYIKICYFLAVQKSKWETFWLSKKYWGSHASKPIEKTYWKGKQRMLLPTYPR